MAWWELGSLPPSKPIYLRKVKHRGTNENRTWPAFLKKFWGQLLAGDTAQHRQRSPCPLQLRKKKKAGVLALHVVLLDACSALLFCATWINPAVHTAVARKQVDFEQDSVK